MRHRLLPAVLLCLIQLPAHAITGRDDVVAAAGGIDQFFDANNAFPEVFALGDTSQGSFVSYCSGTLIDRRTILSAGHCFAGMDLTGDFTLLATNQAESAGAAGLATARVTVHPDYAAGGRDGADLSIVVLAKPVTGTLAALGETVPLGARVSMIGYGFSGTATAPSTQDDGRRRFVENTLDFYGANAAFLDGTQLTIKGEDAFIATDFDHPTDPAYGSLGDANALPNEGTTDGGDSGGPLAIRDENGRLNVLGVLSGGLTVNDIGIYAGYGDVSYYTPVADFRDWITANAGTQTATRQMGDGDWFDAGGWSGGQVPQNNPADGLFYDTRFDSTGRTRLNAEATIDTADIAGPASLWIDRDGRLNAEVGVTAQDQGTLTVDGRLDSPTLSLNRARLDGGGLITADVVGAQATIIPGGGGSRVLNIVGDASLPGSRVRILADGDGLSALRVTGALDVTGGRVGVDLDPDGHSLVGITGSALRAGSLTGSPTVDFAPVGLMAVAATQDTDSLDLSITRLADYDSFATTDNDRALARALAGNPQTRPGLAPYYDTLDLLNPGDVPAALAGMSGQIAAEAPALAIGGVRPILQESLSKGLMFSYQEPERRAHQSASGAGELADVPAALAKDGLNWSNREVFLTLGGNLQRSHRAGGGGVEADHIGGSGFLRVNVPEYNEEGHLRYGFGGTIFAGTSKAQLSGLNQEIDAETLGIILQADAMPLQLLPISAAVGGALHRFDLQRNSGEGHTSGRSLFGGVQARYGAVWIPALLGRLTAHSTDVDGFSESGTATNYRYEDQSTTGGNSLVALSILDPLLLGWRISRKDEEQPTNALALDFTVGWDHRFGDTGSAVTIHEDATGLSFSQSGSIESRDSAAVSLDLTYGDDDLMIQAGYQGRFAQTSSHALSARLNYRW